MEGGTDTETIIISSSGGGNGGTDVETWVIRHATIIGQRTVLLLPLLVQPVTPLIQVTLCGQTHTHIYT